MVSVLRGRRNPRPVATSGGRARSGASPTVSPRAVPSSQVTPTATKLSQVKPGAAAVVSGLEDVEDPTTARRLFDLGFVPGARVEVLRRAPLADPVVFAVAGYEIALR